MMPLLRHRMRFVLPPNGGDIPLPLSQGRGPVCQGIHRSLMALPPRASVEADLELLLSPHTSSGISRADMHLARSSVAVPMFKTQKYFHIGW